MPENLNPNPEEIIKIALSAIYELPAIHGAVVVGITSAIGGYSIKGQILGNFTTRLQIATEVIRQIADTANVPTKDVFTILKGMVRESEIKRSAKPSEPSGGKSSASFTVTKL